MASFSRDGLTLAFLDSGPADGPVVLLIHGFASNKSVNWEGPGWLTTLNGAGYRTIAIDNRGHGDSAKPHEPEVYTPDIMAEDALALLDHLGVSAAHVFGYSMGARISAFLASAHPERVRSVVFGGLGEGMVRGVGDWDPIADALLAPSLDDVMHERGRMFRAFADQTGSDRHALAACIKASRTLVTPAQLERMVMPVLVGVGTRDDIAGDPYALARLLPDGRGFDIEKRDHMLAVGDKTFKAAVLEFLATVETR